MKKSRKNLSISKLVEIVEAKPKNGKKQFMVRVKGENGKVLMTSETLSSKFNAIMNIVATYYSLITSEYLK